MSISHDGTIFDGHATIIDAAGPYEPELIVTKYPGLTGETHLIGKPAGRELFCEYRFRGYSTLALLHAAVQSVQLATTVLTGTLTQTIQGSTQTFGPCTFLGFQKTRNAFFDKISQGYVLDGILRWREREPP